MPILARYHSIQLKDANPKIEKSYFAPRSVFTLAAFYHTRNQPQNPKEVLRVTQLMLTCPDKEK